MHVRAKSELVFAANLGRVLSLRNQGPCFLGFFSGGLQRYVGKHADRNHSFLAAKAVSIPPILRSIRHDDYAEPPTRGEFVRFRSRLGVSHAGNGKCANHSK